MATLSDTEWCASCLIMCCVCALYTSELFEKQLDRLDRIPIAGIYRHSMISKHIWWFHQSRNACLSCLKVVDAVTKMKWWLKNSYKFVLHYHYYLLPTACHICIGRLGDDCEMRHERVTNHVTCWVGGCWPNQCLTDGKTWSRIREEWDNYCQCLFLCFLPHWLLLPVEIW